MSLITVADNLIAKQNSLVQISEELMAQMHNLSAMLNETLTQARLARYGKRARNPAP